jgi:hypothetical protein
VTTVSHRCSWAKAPPSAAVAISPVAAQTQSPMRSHYAPTATARYTFLITRRTERYYLRESRREIHHEARKSAESRRLGVLGRRRGHSPSGGRYIRRSAHTSHNAVGPSATVSERSSHDARNRIGKPWAAFRCSLAWAVGHPGSTTRFKPIQCANPFRIGNERPVQSKTARVQGRVKDAKIVSQVEMANNRARCSTGVGSFLGG